jgi:hypothetical protein
VSRHWDEDTRCNGRCGNGALDRIGPMTDRRAPAHGAVMDRTRRGYVVDHLLCRIPGFPQILHPTA